MKKVRKVRKHGNIHVERAKYNLSQTDLAKAVGVSRQTIHALETGKSIANAPLALKIAAFFKKSIEYLFNDEKE